MGFCGDAGRLLLCREGSSRAVGRVEGAGLGPGTMWKKLIKRGEKVGLGLTQAERKLLLTGLVFLHRHVEEAVRSTPSGEPVMLTLGDLEDLAGHVAAEANHAKDGRTEDRLQAIYEKVEELLDVYAEDDRPAGAAKREIAPDDLGELLANREPFLFQRP